MTASSSFDVVILGAGPAGSVLAEQLSRKGYRVALVDRQKFPRYAIGETLPASVALLLKRAEVVPPDFVLAGAPTTGNLSAWGSGRVAFYPHTSDQAGRGFQVERAKFDAQLLAAARSAGVTVIEGWRPEEFDHADSGWQVDLCSPEGARRRLRTSFVCDASGRARVLARRLRLPQQKTRGLQLGLISYWRATQPRDDADGFNPLVESIPDGWFYTARLNSSQRVAGFMTDRSLLPSNVRRTAPQIYLRALEHARHAKRRLRGFSWDGEVRVFPAYPSLVERCCGPGWLLVGDAASTLDPLCSQGVQKAIASALTAATAVHTLLVHPQRCAWVMEFCHEREHAGFLSHLAARSNYYGREQRFAEQPFWKQRAAPETPPPSRDPAAGRRQASLRNQDRITMGPDVQLQQRPVIEGAFVELRPAVVSPQAGRGVRYCGDLCVPDLMGLLSDRPALEVLLSRYQSLHPTISAASFSRGIAGLQEMRLLQRAG
ncbi:MAG: NAD(P)/FAD-dependent oxidoreductase [Terriglobales bacterium]